MTHKCRTEYERGEYYYSRILTVGDAALAEDYATDTFIRRVWELNARSQEDPITVVVNSHGGLVTHMIAITDTLRAVTAPVTIQVAGVAASAACIIAACVGKGRRFMSPYSRIMMHQPWTITMGDASSIQIEAAEIKALKETIVNLLVEATGKPAKTVRRDIDRDKWLGAQAAQEYGLVDTVGFAPTLLNMNLAELDTTPLMGWVSMEDFKDYLKRGE